MISKSQIITGRLLLFKGYSMVKFGESDNLFMTPESVAFDILQTILHDWYQLKLIKKT